MKRNLIKRRNLVKEEDIKTSEIPTILLKFVKEMAYERNHNLKNSRKEERA